MDNYTGLTELSRKTYAMFDSYGLSSFYQFEVGNLIIYPDEMTTDVQRKVLEFIKENCQYTLGYEENFYYVSKFDDNY